MNAHQAQNMLRIMNSLDEVDAAIGSDAAADFHRSPMDAAMRMDEATWAKVFALIEKRMP